MGIFFILISKRCFDLLSCTSVTKKRQEKDTKQAKKKGERVMNKERIFKRVLSLVLSLAMAAALLPTGLLGGAVTANAAPADALTGRIETSERKIKINEDWRFCLLDKATEINNSLDETASRPDYTESGEWNTVQLPHDWSIYQPFTDSEARPAQGSLAGGTGTLELVIKIPVNSITGFTLFTSFIFDIFSISFLLNFVKLESALLGL